MTRGRRPASLNDGSPVLRIDSLRPAQALRSQGRQSIVACGGDGEILVAQLLQPFVSLSTRHSDSESSTLTEYSDRDNMNITPY